MLGAALTAYDLMATTFLALMTDLAARLTEIPLAAADGLAQRRRKALAGGLLLPAVYPLVLRRAFGERRASEPPGSTRSPPAKACASPRNYCRVINTPPARPSAARSTYICRWLEYLHSCVQRRRVPA